MQIARIAAAVSLVAIAGAAQAKIPANIQLDGYCNTVTNIATVEASVSVGGLWYTCVTGLNYTAGGGMGKTKGGASYMMSIDPAPYGVNYQVVVRADRTWELLGLNGSPVNSGTWSPLASGVAPSGGKDVLAR